ncbi:MerR family transcriptional regulator [[Actinomadura] parvosata]|uniref:MerR family transcriptional regulator n=1 Tax=[Actinomadura] parvosata TaxID=1955412 RepID=UPI00406C3F68
MSDTWTIGELAEHAARALRAGAPAPPNGRVRDVPGERLIRWYTTIGLVDPPLTRRGRIARYGRRHLLQLVAVKRLQAAGRSIAEIQVALAGATDRMLESAAHLDAPLPPPHSSATPVPVQDGNDSDTPSAAPSVNGPAAAPLPARAAADGARTAPAGGGPAQPGAGRSGDARASHAPGGQAQAGDAQASGARAGHREAGAPSRAAASSGGEPVRGRFWAERPGVGAAPAHPEQQPGTVPGGLASEPEIQRSDGRAHPAGTRPADTPPSYATSGGPARTPSWEPGARGEGGERVWGAGVRGVVVTGVRLGDGVRLVLDTGRVPSEEDVQAVLAAARPLLAVLEERELT